MEAMERRSLTYAGQANRWLALARLCFHGPSCTMMGEILTKRFSSGFDDDLESVVADWGCD